MAEFHLQCSDCRADLKFSWSLPRYATEPSPTLSVDPCEACSEKLKEASYKDGQESTQ